MKIFITGAAGHLGRALCREGAAEDTYIGVGRGDWPSDITLPSNLTYHVVDVEDRAKVQDLLTGCDVLIHTAALHLNNGADLPFADFLHANVELSAGLIETGVAAGIRRFVLCSSMTVLVGVDFLGSGLCVLDEDSPPVVDHPYGMSKYIMEQMAAMVARRYDISISCFRHVAFGDVVDGIPMEGRDLIAWWMSERDAALPLLMAARRNDFRGDVFCLSSGTELSHQDLLAGLANGREMLERRWPGSWEILEAAGSLPEPRHLGPITSVKKAARILGWKPQDTFEAWLEGRGWSRT